jgi:hypothetical protein
MSRNLWLGAGSALAIVAATPAAAQTQTGGGKQITVAPYIEASQTLSADLNGDSDVLTYTSLAAGIDAAITTPRVEGQVSYRYERRIAYDRYTGDDDVHSGLARVAAKVAPGLSIEGGALATRTRSDIRGSAPGCWSATTTTSPKSIRFTPARPCRPARDRWRSTAPIGSATPR